MTVLVTGVFDVLHPEHLLFLQKAKKLGGRLLVGLESDARVQKLKGLARPVNSEEARKKNLLELNIADEVFILPAQFDSPDDHRKLLASVRPDILAVSSHTPHIAEKLQLLQEIGGRVEIVHQHNPGISSTKIIENNAR